MMPPGLLLASTGCPRSGYEPNHDPGDDAQLDSVPVSWLLVVGTRGGEVPRTVTRLPEP
jgi:hypothetical protein